MRDTWQHQKVSLPPLVGAKPSIITVVKEQHALKQVLEEGPWSKQAV